METIKIISKKKIEPKEKGAGAYYEIVLSDGSEFVCDQNGENWKPARFPKEEIDDDLLLRKFLAGKSPLNKSNK